MNKRSLVKITVMKKMTAQEIFGEKVPEIVEEGHHICRRSKVGMEFIVKEEGLIEESARSSDNVCWAKFKLSHLIQDSSSFQNYAPGRATACRNPVGRSIIR